jgi:CSLREA domain-containing protein
MSHVSVARLIACLLLVTVPRLAGAALLTVNTTDDHSDGACDAAHCSLREAIETANRSPGADTIAFAIPASSAGCDGGVCVIQPDDALPTLTDAATAIDGFTQPGAQPNSTAGGFPLNALWRIALDGGRLDQCCSPGLHSQGRNVRIRGLIVRGFYDGIYIDDAEGTRITGNAVRNNHCIGVLLSGVEGGPGAVSNVIGGVLPEDRNLIGANRCIGIGIGPGRFNTVIGNVIGLDAAGTAALGNAGDGIRVFGGSAGHRIGGSAAAEVNIIAFNRESGVNVDAGTRVSIIGNRIYSNTDAGIRLGAGSNANLAAPSITEVGPQHVRGTACANCSIEVFSDVSGQGQFPEGRSTASAAGVWDLQAASALRGPFITAVATDPLGNSSPFSAAVQLAPPTATVTRTATPRRTPTVTAAPPTLTPGPCVGDCDASGEVTVDEVIRSVNVALGALPVSQCQPVDLNLDGEVTIDEIVSAVSSALAGCS